MRRGVRRFGRWPRGAKTSIAALAPLPVVAAVVLGLIVPTVALLDPLPAQGSLDYSRGAEGFAPLRDPLGTEWRRARPRSVAPKEVL